MTQHSIPLTKYKTELRNTLSTLMTLMHSWLIRVTLLAGKVFTHNCDTGNHSALIQRCNIVHQIEKEGFQHCQM